MRFPFPRFVAFSLLCCFGSISPALLAQQKPLDDSLREQICREALARPLQTPAFAHAKSEDALKKCDERALYYGFGSRPDFQAALECGYFQREHPDPTVGDPFAGPGILSMLYANGKDVARDYNLAIRFACENKWAGESETDLRIARLMHLRDSHAKSSNFTLCDDGMSGLMEGACAGIREKFADVKRQKELETIERGWSASANAAFPHLQGAENEFEKARTDNEVDMTGTGRNAFWVEERGRLRDQFLINLRRFGRGDVPAASPSDARAQDLRLKSVFEKIEDSSSTDWKPTTIKPDGIKATEETWVKLRDAWLKFGRAAYPSLSPDTIRAQITRLRVHQLESLAKIASN